MLDAARLFGHSQNQIVILASLEAFAEPAHALHQLAAVDTEVRDVVHRQEQIRRPVRLEERRAPSPLESRRS